MRRNTQPRRGIWILVQATIFMGLAVVLAGLVAGYGRHPSPEPPHKLGPAGSATLTDSIQHDLDNCRAIIQAGGKIEDCRD